MKEYFYEVDLSWKSEKTGTLSSHGLKEIEVTFPLAPSREKKKDWAPEQLLGASVSSCFMATFLEIASASGVEIMAYQSHCFVKLEKIKGKYVTTEILLRPKIRLVNDLLSLKAYKCIEEAESTCPVRNAMKINVEIHPQFEYASKGVKKVNP